ncbi:hypothetical protein D3C72_1597740 [compost metagenome]
MALGVAAWMRWQEGVTESGEAVAVDDPLAARTAELIAASENDEAEVRALLSLSAVFPTTLANERRFVDAVTGAFLSLREHGAVEAARRVTE